MDADHKLLTAKEVQKKWGISATKWHKLKEEGKLPPGVVLGGGNVKYRVSTIDMWLRNSEVPQGEAELN